MIRFQRSAQTKKMFPEAAAWAKGVADFINTKCPETKLEVFVARFGEISTIHWFADFDSLPALDGWQMKVMGDPSYWQKIAEAYDFLVQGTVVDTVLMSA